MTAPQLERRAWRARARELRAALTPGARSRAARRIAALLARSKLLDGRRRIALYMSVGTEPDTGPLRSLVRRRGLQLCLPRIRNHPRRIMDFVAAGSARLRPNRHRIAEPAPGTRVPLRALDLIVLPTLAFDRQGTRLGSGAGYYDRALAALALLPTRRRPRLVGICYACNEVPMLAAAAHDVPLDYVVTELELIDCRPGRSRA